MKIVKGLIGTLILCGIMAVLNSFAVFAATDTGRISRVTFSVTAEGIEPGTYADECGVGMGDIKVTSVTVDDTVHEGAETDSYVRVDDVTVVSPDGFLKVGDEIKLGIYIDTKGSNYFKSGAKFSSTGATVASTSRKGEGEYYVTVKLKPIRGNFSEPQNLEWRSGSLGQAKWSAPEANGTGYYTVQLLRNDHSILTVSNYHGTSINFYPWMTKEGEYSFRVRSTAYSDSEKKYGKPSEYAESDSQTVEKEKVSDGSGQTDMNGQGSSSGGGTIPGTGTQPNKVGWVQNGNVMNYYFPDGTMKANGWERIEGKSYYFNASGTMLTGWQTIDGITYCLATDGHLRHGWLHTSDGQWYYLNDRYTEYADGQLVKKAWIDSGAYRYYLTETGTMAKGWYTIDGKTYYFNETENENGPEGSMLINTRVKSFWLGEDGAWVRGA